LGGGARGKWPTGSVPKTVFEVFHDLRGIRNGAEVKILTAKTRL
jgi:hypothetical protein